MVGAGASGRRGEPGRGGPAERRRTGRGDMTTADAAEAAPRGATATATGGGRGAGALAGLKGWGGWVAWGVTLALTLAATVPTTGDIGLTWGEPAYRFSQLRSAQWWERLASARGV